MDIGDILAPLGTPVQQVFWLATFVVAAVGFALGDRWIRLGVALVLFNFALSGPVEDWMWRTIRIGVAALDGLLFAALAVLAWRSRRWWAHAAAAFALLGFFAHLVALADATIWWRAYVGLRWCFSAALVGVLLLGVAETPFARRYERWATSL